MPLSTTPRGSSSFSNPNSPVRRIPRGTSQRSDSKSQLLRQASANRNRIRNMKQRVLEKKDRKALEAERIRLIEVIVIIKNRPEEVTTGTHDVINDAMDEARTIYAAAEKASKRVNPHKKTVEPRRKAQAQPERYTGEYHDERGRHSAAAIAASRPSISADPKADAYQASEYDPTVN